MAAFAPSKRREIMQFDTSDGSVPCTRPTGSSTVDTGDGSVDVGGRLSAVKLHTGDGSVVYRAEPGSSMADDWEITTGDGSVSVYLPQGFGAEVDAHTGDGSIRSDLDGLPPPRREESRRTLRGKIGEGGQAAAHSHRRRRHPARPAKADLRLGLEAASAAATDA